MDNITWRKFPINTMRNEELDYVSYLLGPALAAAPFLFITTAYCKCDDDGVFDIDDGVIFSRLMRLGTPADVIKIAELLDQRRIIKRVFDDENSTVYMITDWDGSQRPGMRKALTAEERRQAVAAQIAAERKKADRARPQQPVFLCPQNDKNAKSVATTERQTEREREQTDRRDQTEERQIEREIDTHTEEAQLPDFYGSYSSASKENETEQNEEIKKAEISSISSIAAEALCDDKKPETVQQRKESELTVREQMAVFESLKGFFARNCLSFSADNKATYNALMELTTRICSLHDQKNSPAIIASVICSQFIQVTQKPGYFQNYPITPETLLKPGIWTHVIAAASKILLTAGATSDAWKRQMDIARQECEESRPAIDNEIEQQCVRYGIDVNDPDRMPKLLRARQSQGTSP